jgi:hypothetical protein
MPPYPYPERQGLEPTAPAATPVQPKYIVDDSRGKASLKTILSLLAFGFMLFGLIVRLLSARDFMGLWILLQRDDTLTFFTYVAPFVFAGWRAWVAWFRKEREVEITDNADDGTAMTKTAVREAAAATIEETPASPTRAREATMEPPAHDGAQ